jgi:hypothetical protein
MTHLSGVWFKVTGPEVASGRTSDFNVVDRERPHAPTGIAVISIDRRRMVAIGGSAAFVHRDQTNDNTMPTVPLDRMTSRDAVPKAA